MLKQEEIVKVSFIGVGNIARQHMQYLKNFQDVRIVGLYDTNDQVLQERQQETGGNIYHSIDEMLDSSNADAVFICIPPYAHGEAEFACIERKIPFMVEKPLAKDMETAERTADAVKRSGVLTSVAYMNRYRHGIQKAKDLLGKYKITMVYGGWIINTPKENHPWLMRKELSGGQILEQTTHIFDLIRYLCGEGLSVHCYGTKGFISITDSYNTEDATGTLIKLKNGSFASVLSSWSSGLENRIYLNLSGPDINIQFTNWEFDTRILLRDSPTPINIPGERNIFEIEDHAFINAIKNDDVTKILSDYSNGVKSLEISIAANKSLEVGNPVQLRDK